MKKLLIALTLGCLIPAAAEAATYYVATNGNDANTCTQAQDPATPRRTLQAGVSCLAGGDTLLIKAGTYARPQSTPPSGSSWSAATRIARYGSDTVTVQGWPAFYASGVQYIILDGLIIDATGLGFNEALLIDNGANHIRILNSEVLGSSGTAGIGLYGSGGFNEILNSKIHNNGSDTQHDHGIYVHSPENLIDGNDIYSNAACGIHYYNSGVSMGTGNIVRGNRIHNNNGLYCGGILIGDTSNIRVYNNLIYDGTGRGIVVWSGSVAVNIYNNTITGNAIYGVEIAAGASNTVIRNNVIYGNTTGAVADNGSGTTYNYNLESDPKFVDLSANDFRLQSSSLAIDTGVDLSSEGITTDFGGGARPQRCCFDIGAYEYAAVVTPPPSSGITVDSTYFGYTTAPIDDGVINASGGAATTWASEDSSSDHWVNIAFSSSQAINTATIYWAYNTYQQKYMTSQTVYVQDWDGSAYQTVATISYPGSDVPSSSASFPAVNTTQLRFYQPANQGNATYPGVFWITELEYGLVQPPAPPGNLVVAAP